MISKGKYCNSVLIFLSSITIIYFHQKFKHIFICSSYAKFQASHLQTVETSGQRLTEVSDIKKKITLQLDLKLRVLDEKSSFLRIRPDRIYELENEMQILIWTPFANPNQDHWDIIFKRLNSKECGGRKCKLVYNKAIYETADAVIFSTTYMNRHNDYEVPPTHPVNQLWVLYGEEATNLMSRQQVLMLSSLGMNWTMHFRHDSDIVSPYGSIRQIYGTNNTLVHNNTDIWSTKNGNKLIVWMVSNCFAESERDSYVEKLNMHVRVDVYGLCGKLKCGVAHGVTTGNHKLKECNDVIKKYFFYLAFENAFCKDYVTEKFYRSLSLDVIPVVMGGVDYKQIAPHHSYINFWDFKSPKHLADYLNKVASDPVLYNKYFEWKSHFILDIGYPYNPFVCGLCEKLHQHRTVNHLVVIPLNLTKWFEDDECGHCSWEEVLNTESHCRLYFK